jgi:hypothetical protein
VRLSRAGTPSTTKTLSGDSAPPPPLSGQPPPLISSRRLAIRLPALFALGSRSGLHGSCPDVAFTDTGFPVRRCSLVSAAQHDPRTHPAVLRSPHSLYEVIGRRTSEDARRSRALVRGAALLRAAEPRPKVFPDTLRRSRALRRGGEHHAFESRKPRPRFSARPAKGAPRLQVECLPPSAPGHGPPFEGSLTVSCPGSPPVETSPPRTVRDASCTPPVTRAS